LETTRLGKRAHDRRVDAAPLSGDELGVLHHRVADPGQGGAQRRIGHRGRIGQAGVGRREAAERHPEAHDAAAVGGGGDLLDRHVAERGDRLEGEALDRVLRVPVRVERPARRL
jgi:hypothetical protein